MNRLPRVVLSLLALALASLAVVTAATPAQAAQFYRYWSYYHVVSGGYTYSKVGIGAYTPAQGTVEAFRYAASSENSPNLPRVDPSVATFSAICGGETAAAGNKLVAVILDYGVEQDADGQQLPKPEAQCADVPTAATTLQVLQKVDDVRTKSSSFGPVLCALDGYPAKGCADVTTNKATPADGAFLPVALNSSSPSSSPSSSGSTSASSAPSPGSSEDPGMDNTQTTEQGRGASPWPYYGLGAAVVLILGGGIYLTRRRRSS